MLKRILKHNEIVSKPPVLVEVGASGRINRSWKKIAKHSICIAFDADQRDFHTETFDSGYKRLIKINKIVSDKSGNQDFYLTKYAHCSSALEPDLKSLKNWLFRDYFITDSKIHIEATTLNDVLDSLGFDNIDWFKTDSQGTDLRIFKKIHDSVRNKVLIAEFEPGLVDAYQGEDKVDSILRYMNKGFFIDKLEIQGEHRIKPETAKKLFSNFGFKLFQITDDIISNESKIFANMTFINDFENIDQFSKRDALLFTAILLLRKQYLACYEFCELFEPKFNDKIFRKIRGHCRRKIRIGMLKLSYYFPYKVYNKIRRDYF